MGFQDKSERNQKVLNSSPLESPGQSNQKVTHVNIKHRFLYEVTSVFCSPAFSPSCRISSVLPLSFSYAPSSHSHTHWVSFSSSTLDPLLLTSLAQFRHWKKTSNILFPRLESLFPFSLLILLLSLLLSLPLLFTFHLLSPPAG